jgi:hypothetical protein
VKVPKQLLVNPFLKKLCLSLASVPIWMEGNTKNSCGESLFSKACFFLSWAKVPIRHGNEGSLF